jgi:hypothetical protein
MEHVHYLHKLAFEFVEKFDIIREFYAKKSILQYFSGYPCAGFGIGESVVMVLHAKAACLGDGMELVVRQIGELAARDTKGVVKLIIGIIHLIDAEYGFQAAFVERLVMCHKRQAFNQGFYLCPHFRKDRSIIGISITESMNLLAPIVIVVRLRLNE